jgi:hypothetical protein
VPGLPHGRGEQGLDAFRTLGGGAALRDHHPGERAGDRLGVGHSRLPGSLGHLAGQPGGLV